MSIETSVIEREVAVAAGHDSSVGVSPATVSRNVADAGLAYHVTFRLPDGSETTLAIPSHRYILEAGLEAGLDLPYRCLQGWCLTCAARIIEGTIDQHDSRRYFVQDRAEGFALLCTGKPQSDGVVETHARDAMRKARDAHRLPYPKGNWGAR
jgi:ferredoxin